MLRKAAARHNATVAKQEQDAIVEARRYAMTCGHCGESYDGREGRALLCSIACEVAFGEAHGQDDLWPCAFLRRVPISLQT